MSSKFPVSLLLDLLIAIIKFIAGFFGSSAKAKVSNFFNK